MKNKNQFSYALAAPLASWIVFICGLFITTYFSYREYKTVQREAISVFENEIKNIESAIKTKIEFYENVLYQTRAFLTTKTKPNREEFNRYVKNISLIERFPGLQGLSYTVRIKPSELEKHIQEVRRSGEPGYKIWPATKRDEYYSIIYLEPINWRNRRALGFDMFTEEIRQKAMARARDTGLPSMTTKLKLVQETKTDVQPGLILFLPIYSVDDTGLSLAERRRNLTGFISSPFRTKDLFWSIFKDRKLDVDFEIYDSGDMTLDHLLFDYDQRPHFLIKNFVPLFKKTVMVDIKGHVFTLFVSTLPAFEKHLRYSHVWIFLGGLMATCLLTWVIFRSKKQAEESSRLKEKFLNETRRLNAVLQQMPEGVLISEPSGKLILRNEQINYLLGGYDSPLEIDESSGVRMYSSGGNIYPKHQWPLARSLQSGEIVRNEEIKVEWDNGKHSVLNVNSSPIRNDDNKIIAGVVLLHDITNMKKIQSELEEAILMRDEFLSIASHELKTPMTSLKLQTQMLKRKIDSSQGSIDSLREKINEVLGLIDKQVSSLNRLVEDMLDISRLRTGKLNITVAEFSMKNLIVEVVDTLKDQIKISGYSDPVVTFKGELTGEWDRMRIAQVIINLLTNSMKYGNRNIIEIHAEGFHDSVRVCVSDQGIGISEDDQKRIFDRFERAISPSEVSGLGLGLFISKQIVKAHGGMIWVKSELNQGSIFTFELPKKTAQYH